jgi:hypothetical protein
VLIGSRMKVTLIPGSLVDYTFTVEYSTGSANSSCEICHIQAPQLESQIDKARGFATCTWGRGLGSGESIVPTTIERCD